MSGTIWIKHSELGAVSEVPASSLPAWRQAGWDLLSDEELAERERVQAEESAVAEQWMRGFAENKPPELPSEASDDAAGRQVEMEND